MTERERLIAFLHHMGIELPLLDDVFDAMLIVWKGAKEDMSEHVRIDQFKIETKVDEAQVKAQQVVALVNMLQAHKADQALDTPIVCAVCSGLLSERGACTKLGNAYFHDRCLDISLGDLAKLKDGK